MTNKHKYFIFILAVPLHFKLEERHLFCGKNTHDAAKGEERLQEGVRKEQKTESPYNVESVKPLCEMHFNGLVLHPLN